MSFAGFRYRLGRLYNSFYYAQSNNKYVLLLLFPGIMWYTRFRADTKLGYRVYISPSAKPTDYDQQANDKSAMGYVIRLMDKFANFVDLHVFKKPTDLPLAYGWKNGMKIYLDDNTTVRGLKEAFYGKDNYYNVLVGCKGRTMLDDDNLALAVRGFCRFDPRIVLWRDL